MLPRNSPLFWAASAYLALALNAWQADRAFGQKPRLRPISLDSESSFEPMQASGQQLSQKSVTYQRIHRIPGGYSVALGFQNFNNDALSVSARFDEKEVAASIAEFGIRQHDMEILDRWYDEARQNANDRAQRSAVTGRVSAPTQAELQRKLAQAAERNARLQEDLNASLDALAKEYRKRRLALYVQSGFQYSGKNVIEVNAPAMVGKSTPRLRALAQSFAGIAAQRTYEAEDLVGAVAAMVQTSLRYEFPGVKEGDLTTGGVLPPLKALVLGQGDCETKAILMGGVLKNWPNLRMVGLEIPEHYLIGVHHIPRQGEVYLEYEGIPYVMIETAGPGWLQPGTVGETTQAFLDSGNEFKIQPF